MSTEVIAIIAAILLAAPFLIWAIIRFSDKILHKFFSWSKFLILISFLAFWTIAIVIITLKIVNKI
ncbi:hypothetical protein [Spiroplasma turonicum]|uniref:Uncharacterized protein n=1 Tax=Spiroplasma turonicum TaxID=216946 RepID=A0A0K1P6P5_9MOLU|nr:hypothetical protein [Spiroplasma turonicum]AKU79537.1 hypothetical protein STURON_00291 [Spiroplasma turonicum]ALX70560.1 hypothetical protein STURO_v1c02920 [Spiroplasma turonicum]